MNRLFRPLALLALFACAAPPPPKLTWADTALSATPEVDEEAVALTDPEGEAKMHAASPLAQGTARFDAVEHVLRERFATQPMPEDAQKAWFGMLTLIDQALASPSRSSREDLLRARAEALGALALDVHAYPAVPPSLASDVRARVQALSARLVVEKRGAPPVAALGWPLWPAVVTSLFGSRPDPFDRSSWKTHQGIDLSAPAGTLVTTAGAGTVVDCGWRQGFGLLVSVHHPDGTVTRYGHLSHALTHEGLTLNAGDPIGLVGATGRATGPHLHFEMWRHGQALDPLIELGDPEVDVPSVASTP